MSPMQRSLAHYRDLGWQVEPVERWIPGARIRRDFFGIGDAIALKSGERPVLIQSTSATNFAARQSKMLENEHLPLLLEHFRVVLHGWGAQKLKRGGKAIRYVLREAEFTAEDVSA